MVLIGFLAQKRSGKDTIGDYLVNNYNFVKRAFADPLKGACREVFHFTNKQLYGDLKETTDKRWGASPRVTLQYIGTDLLRDQLNKIMPELGYDVFLKSFEIWYNNLMSINPNANVVVTDVRFQNEVDLIKKLGGTVYRIDRFENDSWKDYFYYVDYIPLFSSFAKKILLRYNIHISELSIKYIKNYDYIIKNNGTIKQLYNLCDYIFSSQIKRKHLVFSSNEY
jgi:hypothetical protein